MKRFLAAGLIVFAAGAAGLNAGPLLLDNFNEAKKENAIGGATGAWYDPEDKSIFCTAEADAQVFWGPGGRSLRLDYNIESQREVTQVPTNYSVAFPVNVGNQAFTGYYSVFPPQDLSRFSHLILWAKGDDKEGSTRSFKIEIKDGKNTVYKGYVVDGLTGEWRRFAIPLRKFTDIQDWTSIKEFVVAFTRESVTRKKGTVYLDEIYFAESADQNFTVPLTDVTAAAPPRAVTVDGVVKEWPKTAWRNLSEAERVESGARKDAKDAGARFALAWDMESLYLAVQLTDNETVNGNEGDTLWKGDCLEVFLVPNGVDFGWGDPAVFQLGFAPTSAAGNPGRWAWFQRKAPTDAETRVVWSEDRRSVEIALAWSYLGVTPGVNRDLGFALAFHDRDVNDGTPECKLTWSLGATAPGRHRVGKLVLQ